MTVPHITIEQASILYAHAEPMLKLSNELIDKHNARIDKAHPPESNLKFNGVLPEPTQANMSGCQCRACQLVKHDSDCAVHNEPAKQNEACNCSKLHASQRVGVADPAIRYIPTNLTAKDWGIEPKLALATNLVKLTIDDEPAKMLTPAQCEAARLARIDTHDLQFQCVKHYVYWKNTTFEPPIFWEEKFGYEYRLIKKQPKLIPLDWTQSLLKGCNTNYGEFYLALDTDRAVTRDDGYVKTSELKLAPPTNANWRIYIQGETDLSSLKGVDIELKVIVGRGNLTGFDLALRGYTHDSVLLKKAVHYRITGLAEGYGYPEQKGGC